MKCSKNQFLFNVLFALIVFLGFNQCNNSDKYPVASTLIICENGNCEGMRSSPTTFIHNGVSEDGIDIEAQNDGKEIIIYRNIVSEEAKEQFKKLGLKVGVAYEKTNKGFVKVADIDLKLSNKEIAKLFGINWEE